MIRTTNFLHMMRCSTNLTNLNVKFGSDSDFDLDGEAEVPILRWPNFLGLVNVM